MDDRVVRLCSLLVEPQLVPVAVQLWYTAFDQKDVAAELRQCIDNKRAIDKFMDSLPGEDIILKRSSLEAALQLLTSGTSEASSLSKDIQARSPHPPTETGTSPH